MGDRYLAPCQDRNKSGFVPPPPPVTATYRILAETGEVINAENADRLRTETP